MKLTKGLGFVLAGWVAIGVGGAPLLGRGKEKAESHRELRVHLTQANNNSPYAIVRGDVGVR